MCSSVKNYLCGGFLGNFQDKHLSPENSDDEEDGGDADSEAEKYMPKDHKKALKSTIRSRFGLVRKLKVPDKGLLAMGWGPFLDTVTMEVRNGTEKQVHEYQAIVATRETITEQMLSNLSADNRSELLHTIELTHCKLKKSFPTIGSLFKLRVCKLSHNEIIFIKKANFSQGMFLEWLVCDYNKLEAIEPRVISSEFLPWLQVLNFSHNKLSFLPQDFAMNLEALRYLDLSYNKLQQLPEAITTCANLQLCFLQANELSKLPAGIHKLGKLRKLFASYNHLTQLPETIGQCRHLEKLHVSSNKISLMPNSIIDLWKKKGGSLEELGVDCNPLVQPGLSAFEKGQLDIGFELFAEWLKEQDAQRALEEQAAEIAAQEALQRPSWPSLACDTDTVVQRAQGTIAGTMDHLADHYANVRELEGVFDSEGVADEPEQTMLEDGDESGTEMMASEGRGSLGGKNSMEKMLEEDADYYFSHLQDQDASGTDDKGNVAQLRSLESTMLLVKKVKYLEGRKALAKAKKDECLIHKREMPRHLDKYLHPDFTVSGYTGNIPVTAFDLHFCILVYVTKPLEPNCAQLFERFTVGADKMTHSAWDDLCTHVKVTVPKEVQQEMWDCMSSGKDSISKTDFIAAWHIHDVGLKDPWIRRAARVLKLNYYNMDLGELRERLKAKSAQDPELKAGEGEGSELSFSSNIEGGKGSSSSSEESGQSQEEERRRKQLVQIPLVEGERRLRSEVSPRQGKGGRGSRGEAKPPVRQPPPAPGRGGSSASNSRPDVGKKQYGKVSLTEEQQFALSRTYDEESGQESVSSGETFPSEELSIKSNTTVSSFDAGSELGHLESEEEAARAETLDAKGGQRMEIKSDLDILKLMDMSPTEVLVAPPKKQKEEELQRSGRDLIKKKVRELRSKNTQKDARFRTDVFTVRLALREAQRNMTEGNFASLVNFLIRSLKHIANSSSAGWLADNVCWHVDNPTFRHATGIEAINPYVRQLLEQMGFVCLKERWWVWPEKHLNMGDTGSWGRREVKPSCAGRDEMRIVDMVELFTRCQKNLWRSRHG